jgi:hypothetical protein
MHNRFLIADHAIEVEDDTLSALLVGFECNSENQSALGPCDQEPICSVGVASVPPIHGVEQLDSDFPIQHVLTLTRFPDAVLVADDLFQRVTLRSLDREGLADLLLLATYSRLSYYHTVFVHGALIDDPDLGGILFVGRSGVGKSTQAELWKLLRGAEVINGDKVFLSVKPEYPNEIFGYGSPWAGSSPYRVCKRVSLRAIVYLERSEERVIHRLDDVEALFTYMPSVFMPNWDTRLTEQVMDTLDMMMPRVPIYRMSCGLDVSGPAMLMKELRS